MLHACYSRIIGVLQENIPSFVRINNQQKLSVITIFLCGGNAENLHNLIKH